MRDIVYYVASSLDGYIAGPDDAVDSFIYEGSGVTKYFEDLKSFDTVIMGRKTYEVGYKYGMKPGQPAYPHMQHYIFSKTLEFEQADEKVTVCQPELNIIRELKTTEGTDIYLCGGGEFAGWLLDNQMIDKLKIKLNPLLLGSGIRLFGNSESKFKLEMLENATYDHGLQIISYMVNY